MNLSPYKMLLSPAGRMGRKDFWIAMALFAALVLLFNFALQRLGNSTLAFLISLPFPFLVLHMAYCVYGKRLHDMGHSFWPLTGMIVFAFFVIPIIVILAYGGSEMFSDFSQYGRKEEIDPAVRKEIQDAYQAELKESVPYLPYIIYAVISAFTLWCGLSNPEDKPNIYGPELG
ncbi:DUF805 domain-containing protein [Hellea sp.]|nr:DUF805 domain-containing protein [Hellea sp.]